MLAKQVIKQRTQESIWLLLDIQYEKEEKGAIASISAEGSSDCSVPLIEKINGPNLSSLLNLQVIKYIDDLINKGNEKDCDPDDIVNTVKYNKELTDFAKKNKKIAGQYASPFQGLNESKGSKSGASNMTPDQISEITKSNLESIYSLMSC